MRVKKSIGSSAVHNGASAHVSESKFVLDRTRKFYMLDVVPFGAVRMTQSDRWKTNPEHQDERKRQRPAVTRYFAFKDAVRSECAKTGFVLRGCIDAVFCIPMPDSWSDKKKARMNGMPHKTKPDTDNILKGLCDALKEQDSDVWRMVAEKRHSYRGAIILFD